MTWKRLHDCKTIFWLHLFIRKSFEGSNVFGNLDVIFYDVNWTQKKLRIIFIYLKYQKTFWSKNYLQDCVTKMTMWCRRQVYFHQRLLSSSAGPMYNSSTPLTLEFQKNVQVAYLILKNKSHVYFFQLKNLKCSPYISFFHQTNFKKVPIYTFI